MIEGMKAPLFIRPLTPNERSQIQAGLRSSHAFVLRRSQMLLASARGERAPAIARYLGCDDQTVRNAIKGFNTAGLAVLNEGSSRPHRLRTIFTIEAAQQLKALLQRARSPRLWTRPWSVDPGTRCQNQFRAGHYPPHNVGGERAPSAPKHRDQLEACQTLDYQPRPVVPAKKTHEIG